MQFNQMCVPDEASVQVYKNCSAILDCPAALETLPQRENVKQFQETMNSLYSKGVEKSTDSNLAGEKGYLSLEKTDLNLLFLTVNAFKRLGTTIVVLKNIVKDKLKSKDCLLNCWVCNKDT